MRLDDIPQFHTFCSITPLTKGFSPDRKFYIEGHAGQKYLLRIASIAEYARKKNEFSMMQRAELLGILLSNPVDFGKCNDGKSVYALLTWLEGTDAEVLLPTLSEPEQYRIGQNAGKLLQTLHTLPASRDAEPWHTRFAQKIATRLTEYAKLGDSIEAFHEIAAYLREQQSVLADRPQTFNHGDFSVGNIIVTPAYETGVIDFNFYNADYGDPWWELWCMPWGQTFCAAYQTGLIHGYFDRKPDESFFSVLSVYAAYDAIAALCDTAQGHQGMPEEGRRHAQNILSWFQDFHSVIPSWYRESGY